MSIDPRILALQEEVAGWRRDFHAHPELGYEVHRTAGIVAAKLREFGCDEVTEGIGKTGVVGIIHGRKGAGGRVIGLRADMDALPIEEETNLPHRSTISGKMHACGHDGHTAMLLGAAKHLAATREFDGSVAVIFQPAEEGGGGGKAMVEDGMMDRWNIKEVYGMHNMPGMPAGAIAVRPVPSWRRPTSSSSASKVAARMLLPRISASIRWWSVRISWQPCSRLLHAMPIR